MRTVLSLSAIAVLSFGSVSAEMPASLRENIDKFVIGEFEVTIDAAGEKSTAHFSFEWEPGGKFAYRMVGKNNVTNETIILLTGWDETTHTLRTISVNSNGNVNTTVWNEFDKDGWKGKFTGPDGGEGEIGAELRYRNNGLDFALPDVAYVSRMTRK